MIPSSVILFEGRSFSSRSVRNFEQMKSSFKFKVSRLLDPLFELMMQEEERKCGNRT